MKQYEEINKKYVRQSAEIEYYQHKQELFKKDSKER